MSRMVLALAATGVMSGLASGQSLHQPMNALSFAGAGSTTNSAIDSTLHADNFVMPEDSIVTRIDWGGYVYNGGTPADIQSFLIEIYADGDPTPGVFGTPGALLWSDVVAIGDVDSASLGMGPVLGSQQTYYSYGTNVAVAVDAGDWWLHIAAVMKSGSTSKAFSLARHIGSAGDDMVVKRATTLSDPFEQFANVDLAFQLTVAPAGPPADTDGDGLSDVDEAIWMTDPENPDTDGDGLSDGDEVHQQGTNPALGDTDGDGLLDGTEVSLQGVHGCLSPLSADSDGDTVSDGFELLMLGTNPCLIDTDGDGLPDDVDPEPYADLIVETVQNMDAGLFDAPNANAAKGKRGALANQFGVVLLHVANERYAHALNKLNDLSQTIDEWVLPGPDRDELQQFVTDLAAMISGLL